jgi:hypothetical protein
MTKPVTIPYSFGTQTGTVPASNLDNDFTALSNAINDFITFSNYTTDSGSANSYLINFPTGFTTVSLVAGSRFQFIASGTNTGASTLQVQINGSPLGTASIKLSDGSALPANTIIAGGMVDVMYDGTNFQLMNNSAGGSLTVTNLNLSGNLSVGGNITATKTITAASNIGAYSYGNLSYTDTNNFAVYQTSANSYAQIVMQNTNTGAGASTDFTVSNNLGNATAYYGNFGINSSGFTGSGSLNLGNATYVTATTGDLAIGTTTSNSVHFVVNSGTTDAMTINANNTITILASATANGTVTFNNTVTMTSSINAAGNLSVLGYFTATNNNGTQIGTSGNVAVLTNGYANNTAANVVGVKVNHAAGTHFGSNITGTYGYLGTIVIQQPTYTFGTATTITNASNVLIVGAPVASSNATFTNSYALQVQSGLTNLAGGLSLGGNVTADFSNATITSRTSFVTSTVNGTTGIYALPNGTSTAASWQAASTADPTNTSKILIATNGSTDVQLVSGINGTGTYLPLSFYNGGSQRMQLGTTGLLAIGTSLAPGAKLHLGTDAFSFAPWTTSGVGLRIDASTFTSTSTLTGTVAIHSIAAPTLAATTVTQTVTNAATLYIAAAPTAGTNVTITNPYALYVAAGASYFAGTVTFGSAPTFSGTLTASNTTGTKLQVTGNDTAASWTTSGIGLRVDAGTFTDSTSTGTVTQEVIHAIGTPTLAASSATTFGNASTFYIDGPPTAGTNATITQPWSFFVNSGRSAFTGGFVTIGATSTVFNSLLTLSTSATLLTGLTTSNFAGAAAGSALGVMLHIPQVNSPNFGGAAATYGYAGTVTIRPTNWSFANATTINTAATIIVSGEPGVGTNATYGNAWGLFINTGGAYIGGRTNIDTNTSYANNTATSQVGFVLSSGYNLSTNFTNPAQTFGYQSAYFLPNQSWAYSNATTITNASTVFITGAPSVGANATFTNAWALYVNAGNVAVNNGLYASTASGRLGYSTGLGAGSAVTQLTSRTTGVTINTPTGAITLFSAAGSGAIITFTVTNSSVAATDTILTSTKSSTNNYFSYVSAVAAGSFNISFIAYVGTAVDSPVFNFAVIKASAT